ncbi:integrin alpha-V [Cricetulus griseus]|uniref:Integrin alpha-V n=1 Tax=Cricetulus griseus TaxID=10029 RepID=A0A061I3S1_CRIGR|nr:integrin alpha-V [Cricetulus griseus]
MFLLVGAPKANTTQPGIVEGGQVLKCDCSSSRRCQPIEFDSTARYVDQAGFELTEICLRLSSENRE